MRRLAVLALLLSAALPGCATKRQSSATSVKKSLAPLSAPSWSVELAVEGFAPATVAVPLGATASKPVLIALGGAADRPEWQCGSWRGIVGSGAFVLCPRGRPSPLSTPSDPRFTVGPPHEAEPELRAALKALKQNFGEYVAKGSVAIAGFSSSAETAAALARQEPAFFARVALIGQGSKAWSPSLASLFGKGGGKRVLFVCSDRECREESEAKAVLTRRTGAEARVSGSDLGPWFDAEMVAGLRREFAWLVDGDPRWSSAGT